MGAIRHQVVVRGGSHQAPSALTGTIDEMLFAAPSADQGSPYQPGDPTVGGHRSASAAGTLIFGPGSPRAEDRKE